MIQIARAWWQLKYGAAPLLVQVTNQLPADQDGEIDYSTKTVLISERTQEPMLTVFHELDHWWVHSLTNLEEKISEKSIDRMAKNDLRSFRRDLRQIVKSL